eukprot:gene25832-31198_t
MSTTPTGAEMNVGLGSSGTLANSWGPLDIIGHEYTHAVTATSAKLIYQNESGALDESFSDIFGESIENYTLGSNDWLIGTDRTDIALRNMANPSIAPYNDPDTYLGTNWISNPNIDFGGVHTNSGVQNYWFYLLSQGGSGTNDNGNSFNVQAIGITKARAIAFRTLTVNLFNQPNATYAMARTASIQSAEEIYGINSVEASTVKNAWCAVGVGNVAPAAVTIPGGGNFCNAVIINATGGSGGNIYFQGTNSNGTSTAILSSSQTVTASGTYYFRAYNACGWGPAGSVTVTINNSPSTVTTSGGGTFCNSATISASGGAGGTIYFQGTNSNGTSELIASSSQLVSASGTYYFRAKNNCGWSTAGSVTVTIVPMPAAVSVAGSGTFCNSATITASGGAGGTIYYQGTTSNGTSSGSTSLNQVLTNSGTYYFRSYNATCGWGTQGSATITIQTTPAAVSITGSGTVCNSTTITASGGAGGTIYWQGTTNNGVSTATPSTSQPITSSGTYYFRSYNATCGWGTQGSTTITIITTPSPVSVSGGGTICGNSTTLNGNGGNGGTVYWQGTNSNGTSTATPSISQIVSASGTYYFRANNGCGWGTAGSATVTIVPTSLSLNGSAINGLQKAVNTISSNQSIISGRN